MTDIEIGTSELALQARNRLLYRRVRNSLDHARGNDRRCSSWNGRCDRTMMPTEESRLIVVFGDSRLESLPLTLRAPPD
jgi:hypothetical protein